jgi:hypothetical protein
MVTEQFRKILSSGVFEEFRTVYADDALLDVNVPCWRFQRQGPRAIIDQFRDWYPVAPPRISGWRERPTGWGAAVESEEVEGDGAEALLSRTMHLLVIDDDLITEHTMYCTGPWDAATVTRHRAEAPMVRW